MKGPSMDDIVKNLDLKPHPEGGYYRETYRAQGKFGDKNYSTGIYFLLTKGNFSAFHRIKSDEIWHFYTGDPITIVEITNNGETKETILGSDILKKQVPQYVVPAGTWFGSYVHKDGEWGLVGCTVSPGFDFKDFELGKRDELLKTYPKAKSLIEKLTRE